MIFPCFPRKYDKIPRKSGEKLNFSERGMGKMEIPQNPWGPGPLYYTSNLPLGGPASIIRWNSAEISTSLSTTDLSSALAIYLSRKRTASYRKASKSALCHS